MVLSAWAADLHRFDLELTISRYVGLRHWTSYLYMVVASVMVILAAIHLKRTEMGRVRKIVYIAAFACVLGCAVCPMNRDWSERVSDLHNLFAYSLMLVVTTSFIMMAARPLNKEQRVFSKVAIGYAVLFILCYVIIKWRFFIDTIFL